MGQQVLSAQHLAVSPDDVAYWLGEGSSSRKIARIRSSLVATRIPLITGNTTKQDWLNANC